MISTAQVFWVALFTALATGLGALPVLFLNNSEPRWRGIAAATASGMMLSASVFALADEALSRGAALEVMGGMMAGALFFSYTAKFIDQKGWTMEGLNQKSSRQTLLLLLTLFVHSIPEGAAIGVGYATGEIKFGWLLAVAIAVHNIPEGTAVSLPLRANGASMGRCIWYSILTSMPQPIVAVPAFLLVSVFQPLLPASLGFAGGAMIFLVVSELLPESLRHVLDCRDGLGCHDWPRRHAGFHCRDRPVTVVIRDIETTRIFVAAGRLFAVLMGYGQSTHQSHHASGRSQRLGSPGFGAFPRTRSWARWAFC